jgi:cobalt-zinc-cadmium efflux system protein
MPTHSHGDANPGHDHAGHGHGRRHHYIPQDFGRAFVIGIGLNTVFLVAEATFGFLANSTALVADAGHNLSDVLGLLVAWIAATLAKRAPTPRLTYGLRNASILAAMINAILLLLAAGAITLEAVQRLASPEPIKSLTVIAVAAVGILVNGLTAWLFFGGRETDLNIRGAYLHMVADALVSVGVVIGGTIILFTGALWVDPVISLVIVVVIVWSTWGLLRESTAMSLAAVPKRIDPAAVRAFLRQRPGVAALHDLHIWPISTTETALTAHLVIPAGHPGDDFLAETAKELRQRFDIGHTTLQVETDAASSCVLAPETAV